MDAATKSIEETKSLCAKVLARGATRDAAAQAALAALPIELHEITGEEVLVSRARDLAIALRCTDEVALTYLTLDIDTQLQRARAELSVCARGAREQLERANDRKRAAERFTAQLRTACSETAFRLPRIGLTLCAECARKGWLHETKAILTEDAPKELPQMLLDCDWACDVCDNRSWAGTVAETYRAKAGRNG